MNDRPLNVLITDPHLKGGGQVRYVTNLSRELVRLGHRVTIGCKEQSVLVDVARETGAACANHYIFKGGLRPQVWRHDLALAQGHIQDDGLDVIHVSGSQDHWIHGAANWRLGRPVCLVRTRHNTYPVSNHLGNRILNRAWTDYQIVVCDVVRRTLAAQSAFDGARMCSIHNGVDAEAFRPQPDVRKHIRDELGYTDDHVVFGIAARIVEAKGHEFLIRAAAQLARDYPHMRVLVLGQGGKERAMKDLAASLGVAGVTTFAGFQSDMARYVQAMDIGVQPSVDCDTSSFSLKEQMAAEKPVIASDYGGLVEIVDDGVEGLVVPTGTLEPLAAAMKTLLDHPDQAREMGLRGRERVLREFTMQIFAERTVEAYRRAIDVHRTRTARLNGHERLTPR